MVSREEVEQFRREVEKLEREYMTHYRVQSAPRWIDDAEDDMFVRRANTYQDRREVIIDGDKYERTVWQGNEAQLHQRIKELESKLEVLGGSGAATMTSATINHEQNVLEKSYLHKAVGYSNKVVLCGIGGNIVMGPVVGYLTDNFWMLAAVELVAAIIFVCGLVMRPTRDAVLSADKSEIRSRHLLSDAVNNDAQTHAKEIQIKGVA